VGFLCGSETIPPGKSRISGCYRSIAGFVLGSILGGILAHELHKKTEAKFPQFAPLPSNPAGNT
jgi:hypothetical protein